MWNLVNIPSGIFIVDHACETMHNACKTGALMRKFAFGANKTPIGMIGNFRFIFQPQNIRDRRIVIYKLTQVNT